MVILTLMLYLVAGASGERDDKQFSIFQVIKFPNDACVGAGSLNGTCYTSTECTSLGGSGSGACASSFGVCCVFSLACGGETSANGSYAIINSYSTSTDTDPCIYKYCKTSDDVCKLRIEFVSLVLGAPVTVDQATVIVNNGYSAGSCLTDTLAVGVPGFTPPPVICGYNTGQHMWVPASDSCVTINLDIDTDTATTTRNWNIKVTQYECGNLIAPEQNCLQYHTASLGTIASFNWDTSSTSNVKTVLYTNVHLVDQHYDICIRRNRGYCSLCFSPELAASGTATIGSSFGVSAGSDGPALKGATDSKCSGITTHAAIDTNADGHGDYLVIEGLQNSIYTAANGLVGANIVNKICGWLFNAMADNMGTALTTVCTFKTPFRVGVHFDASDALGVSTDLPGTDNYDHIENAWIPASTAGEGIGYSGFWLAYWQNTC